MIIARASISGNNTKQTSRSNMHEFSIMKACKVDIRPPRAPVIKKVVLSPPITPWIKVNTYGASIQNPIRASTGGIFRNEEVSA
jgi:hypothetical protein